MAWYTNIQYLLLLNVLAYGFITRLKSKDMYSRVTLDECVCVCVCICSPTCIYVCVNCTTVFVYLYQYNTST